jgi:hypothetical protein
LRKKSSESEYRWRLDKLASVLQRFGLVDDFRLKELLWASETPTVAVLERRINHNRAILPPGITASFVARSIAKELEKTMSADSAAPSDGDKVTVLFFTADPSQKLHLDEEVRQCQIMIRASDCRDNLVLVTSPACRADDLLQALNQHKPGIVHFSGHGSLGQEIILLDDQRQAKPVSAEALESLFGNFKDCVRLVVLNACYSLGQAKAICKVVDCAVGMSKGIGDDAAIVFAGSFYRALGFGRSVRAAFEQAKTAILLQGIPEENTPVLVHRKGIDPQQLFLVR